MSVSVEFVGTQGVKVLSVLKGGDKRMAYAIANAINATAKDVQAAQRAHIQQVFKLRKGDFILRQSAIIKPFASATKRSFEAVVSVGKKERLLLTGYEAGDTRRPVKGKRAAVPIIGGPVRPNFSQSVPDTYLYKSLRLRPTKSTSTKRVKVDVKVSTVVSRKGTRQLKGEHRTFVLPRTAKASYGGVFQRVGPRKEDIRMIYSFVPPGKLPRILGFTKTARRAINKVYRQHLADEIRKTIQFAR
jgi:hypothetical protein